MNQNGEPKEQIPADDMAIGDAWEKNRAEMDKVPAPGTDPLHEGP
jgi:hypothetical protein